MPKTALPAPDDETPEPSAFASAKPDPATFLVPDAWPPRRRPWPRPERVVITRVTDQTVAITAIWPDTGEVEPPIQTEQRSVFSDIAGVALAEMPDGAYVWNEAMERWSPAPDA